MIVTYFGLCCTSYLVDFPLNPLILHTAYTVLSYAVLVFVWFAYTLCSVVEIFILL